MADLESLRQVAHSRAPLSTWLGVVLLFALFAVIVLAVIGPAPRGSGYEETRAKKRMETLKTVREEAEKALNTYGWIDKNKGVARIPISRAMELTIADLAQQKPAVAGPIAMPEPQANAAPASAGSPKPGAAQPDGWPSAPIPAASASPPPQTASSPQKQATASSPPAARPGPSAPPSRPPATTP
jgi:hypothetical protein